MGGASFLKAWVALGSRRLQADLKPKVHFPKRENQILGCIAYSQEQLEISQYVYHVDVYHVDVYHVDVYLYIDECPSA